jgi:hypothetical protein
MRLSDPKPTLTRMNATLITDRLVNEAIPQGSGYSIEQVLENSDKTELHVKRLGTIAATVSYDNKVALYTVVCFDGDDYIAPETFESLDDLIIFLEGVL